MQAISNETADRGDSESDGKMKHSSHAPVQQFLKRVFKYSKAKVFWPVFLWQVLWEEKVLVIRGFIFPTRRLSDLKDYQVLKRVVVLIILLGSNKTYFC